MVFADPLLPDLFTTISLWLSWDNLAVNLSLGQLHSSHCCSLHPVGSVIGTGKPYGVCYSADPDTMFKSLGCPGQAPTDAVRNECSAVEVLLG